MVTLPQKNLSNDSGPPFEMVVRRSQVLSDALRQMESGF